MLSSLVSRQQIRLTTLPVRAFTHPQWCKKTRHLFKPKYFDDINYDNDRRWDTKKRRFRYRTQDPLFFDYEMKYLSGDISNFYRFIQPSVAVPLHKRAYLLYHMGRQGVYDEKVVEKLEENLALAYSRFFMTAEEKKASKLFLLGEKHLFGRYAWGAVIGYYKGNFGTAQALKYWEYMML